MPFRLGYTVLPEPAALRIFFEVFSEYAVLLEADRCDTAVCHFLLDVQHALRTLYPIPATFTQIHADLLSNPKPPNGHLLATRAALGQAFLTAGLWPLSHYFQRQK